MTRPNVRQASPDDAPEDEASAAAGLSYDPALVALLEERLALHALRNDSIEDILTDFCETLLRRGVPIARVMVAWRVLHPLHRARDIIWRKGLGLVTDVYPHDEPHTQRFLGSPLRHLLYSESDDMRFRIADPDERRAFPEFDGFFSEGLTDYYGIKTAFGAFEIRGDDDGTMGMVVTFAADTPGGFTDAHIATFKRLRYMLAVASRTVIQRETARSVAHTYLGKTAGDRVLHGAIRLGDGEYIPALVWYADMRGSTACAERLEPAAYVALLNRFFAATAGAVMEHGGEVLDFIGDAVLAVFPTGEDHIDRALGALDQALCALEDLKDHPAFSDLPHPAGIALAMGTVMFGNIGVPDRLSFSVIGTTVNEVARIEGMTKVLAEPVLVTEAVRRQRPERWVSKGAYRLAGIAHPVELYGLAPGRLRCA